MVDNNGVNEKPPVSAPSPETNRRLTEDEVEQLTNREAPDEVWQEQQARGKIASKPKETPSKTPAGDLGLEEGAEKGVWQVKKEPTRMTPDDLGLEEKPGEKGSYRVKSGLESPKPLSQEAQAEKSLADTKDYYEKKLRLRMRAEAKMREKKMIYRMLGTRKDLREGEFSIREDRKNGALEKAKRAYLDEKDTAIRNQVGKMKAGMQAEGKQRDEIEKAVALERHRLNIFAAAENYQKRKEIGKEILPPREQGIIGRGLRQWSEINKKWPWFRYGTAITLGVAGAGLASVAWAPAAMTAFCLYPRLGGILLSSFAAPRISEKIRKARLEGGTVLKIFKFKGKEATFKEKEAALRSVDEKDPFKRLEDIDKDFRLLQKEKGLYDYNTIRASAAAAIGTGAVIGGTAAGIGNVLQSLDATSVLAGRGGLGAELNRAIDDLRNGQIMNPTSLDPAHIGSPTTPDGMMPGEPPAHAGVKPLHEKFSDDFPPEAELQRVGPGSFPNDMETPYSPVSPLDKQNPSLRGKFAIEINDDTQNIPGGERISSPRNSIKGPFSNEADIPRKGSDGPRLNEYPESPDAKEVDNDTSWLGNKGAGKSPKTETPWLGEPGAGGTKEGLNVPPETGIAEKSFEPVIHKVTRRENVWKILTNEARTRGLLENLSGGKETHFIDSLKDKLAALSPDEVRKLGISSGDINKIKAGETIDLTKIFGDQNSIEASQYQASRLGVGDVANIEKNNAAIAEWRRANPGAALNDNVVDSIIRRPKGAAPSELPGSPEPLPGVEVGNDNVPTPAQIEAMSKIAADNAVNEIIESQLGSKSSWIPWFNQKGAESSAWMNGQRLSVKEILATHRGSAREIGLSEGDLFKLQNLTRSIMTNFGIEPNSAAETLKKFIYRAVTNPGSTPEALKELIGKAIGAKAA